MSVLCQAEDPSFLEYELSFPSGVFGQVTSIPRKIERYNAYIDDFYCDSPATKATLKVIDQSTGSTICSMSTETLGNCEGKPLTYGKDYIFEGDIGNLFGINCYVNTKGKIGYLYSYAADGTFKFKIDQTTNCQSQDILQNLKNSGINTLANETTFYKVTGLTPSDGSVRIPFYYMQVANIQPDYNPEGYLVQCDSSLKSLKGYAKMPSLDGQCWVTPTASKEIIQGHTPGKSNYVENFACAQSYCDLTIYSGWEDYQCLPRTGESDCRTNGCETGYECVQVNTDEWFCQQEGTSPVGTCKALPEQCFERYEMTRSDGQAIFVEPVLVPDSNCPEGTGKCDKKETLIMCRLDINYPDNQCCYQNPNGSRYLDDCHGTVTSCDVLGVDACCVGSTSYTPKEPKIGEVCCDPMGEIVTNGVGTSLLKSSCDAKKGTLAIDPLQLIIDSLGLQGLSDWLRNLIPGLPDLTGILAIVIVLLIVYILFKLFLGRGRGGGGGATYNIYR